MNLRDTLERLWWTFVAAFIGTVTTSPVLLALVEALSATPVNIDIAPVGYVLLSGAIAGLVAVANLVSLIARYRLSVLPDPGAGLPGLPTPPVASPPEYTPIHPDAATRAELERLTRQARERR